jgi:hypothetical protein
MQKNYISIWYEIYLKAGLIFVGPAFFITTVSGILKPGEDHNLRHKHISLNLRKCLLEKTVQARRLEYRPIG